MKPDRKHLAAMIVTLLFHAAVVALLMVLYLRYDPVAEAAREWPPVDSSEVLFGGEYVMVGDSPDVTESSDNSESSESPEVHVEALENTGTPAETPSPIVTSERPSPAKAPKTERPKEPTGPSKAEIEAAERAKREAEARETINNRVKFGKSGTGGSGEGKQGQPDGNSATGAVSGTPGVGGLSGRTLAAWDKPVPAPMGSITIAVTVNRKGEVIQASYRSGTGAAAASTAARNSCIAAARKSKFSVDLNAPAEQRGTITYHFK